MTDVLFVLGYLGSGKTTFVKNFLSEHPGKNAVLVNDFGAEDVDGLLLSGSAVRVESIFGGSVFCSCRSEKFVETMLSLADGAFDRILVETSGFSNPFQMRKLFSYVCECRKGRFRFAGAVCLADARNAEKVLYTVHAVKMQIAAADIILINKTDLAGTGDCARLEKALREINPDAPVHLTVGARMPGGGFPVKERILPPYLEDITVQKLKILLKETLSDEMLFRLGESLSGFCHRIKGVVSREGKGYTVYEFIDGKARFQPTEKEGDFLILLAAGKFSLRERAEKVLEKTGVQFEIC